MSKALKYTFIVHIVVAVVFGVPLLLLPGRFLELFGWAPVDPLLSRVLGAALLAQAWSSFRVSMGADAATVMLLLEVNIVFAALSAIGFLRHLLFANYPPMVWFVFALFVVFTIAWTLLLLNQSKQQTGQVLRQS